jgi:hypothetical protein
MFSVIGHGIWVVVAGKQRPDRYERTAGARASIAAKASRATMTSAPAAN